MPDALIRPLRPSDREAVGRVAYETGFFGASAARYFPDAGLFAELWVGPYFAGAGAACLVAEVGGAVQGYILGSPDHALYGLALRRVLLERVLPGVLTGRYPRALGALPYLARAARFPGPHADQARYPAHLHINLLPGTRGLGLGEGLLRAHLDGLARLGLRGVQLSTTDENAAALGLYRKLDFHEAAARVTPLWTPWLGHPARHVVMAREVAGRGR